MILLLRVVASVIQAHSVKDSVSLDKTWRSWTVIPGGICCLLGRAEEKPEKILWSVKMVCSHSQ